MTECSQRGLFVVVEGVDRVGKTTQVTLLAKALNKLTNRETLCFRFPDRQTPIGKNIDNYLAGKHDIDSNALHLLFTANRWERQTQIRSAIANGTPVVSDRYTYSGIVYTTAKPAPTPDWHWCIEMEKGLLRPDLVICLIPDHLDELFTRKNYGEERYENIEYQNRVLENYVRLSMELDSQEKDSTKKFWHFVQSTNRSIDEVHDCIMSIIRSKLETMQQT